MDFDMNEPLSLTNICGGDLEADFQKLYRKLVAQLEDGEKASLSINIDLSRVPDTMSMYNVGYKVTPKYPAKGRNSMVRVNKDNILCTEKADARRPKVVNLGMFNVNEDGEVIK